MWLAAKGSRVPSEGKRMVSWELAGSITEGRPRKDMVEMKGFEGYVSNFNHKSQILKSMIP